MEEVDYLFGPRQAAEIAIDDDTVEAVVYKYEQAVEQFCKDLHRSPPDFALTTRSSVRRPVEFNRLQRLAGAERFATSEHLRRTAETATPFQNFKYFWLGIGP